MYLLLPTELSSRGQHCFAPYCSFSRLNQFFIFIAHKKYRNEKYITQHFIRFTFQQRIKFILLGLLAKKFVSCHKDHDPILTLQLVGDDTWNRKYDALMRLPTLISHACVDFHGDFLFKDLNVILIPLYY